MHSIVCIYHNLLLKHSTVDEYLDSSQFGFITNNATINIPINIFKWMYVYISIRDIPRSKTVDF